MGFKFVFSWQWFNTRSVNFFFGLFLYFQKPKHVLKKPMLSKLLEVTVYISVTPKSTFKGFTSKDAALETEFFCITWWFGLAPSLHISTPFQLSAPLRMCFINKRTYSSNIIVPSWFIFNNAASQRQWSSFVFSNSYSHLNV